MLCALPILGAATGVYAGVHVWNGIHAGTALTQPAGQAALVHALEQFGGRIEHDRYCPDGRTVTVSWPDTRPGPADRLAAALESVGLTYDAHAAKQGDAAAIGYSGAFVVHRDSGGYTATFTFPDGDGSFDDLLQPAEAPGNCP